MSNTDSAIYTLKATPSESEAAKTDKKFEDNHSQASSNK
jgi:hypothetical protein